MTSDYEPLTSTDAVRMWELEQSMPLQHRSGTSASGLMPPMVKRVADAISIAGAHWLDQNDPKGHLGWADVPSEVFGRAAIEAMRQPTTAMRHVCTFDEAEVTWPAMIDAALASPTKE